MRRLAILSFAALLLTSAHGLPAKAEVLVTISTTQQQLAVTVDGKELYRWPVSTGRPGLTTPAGSYRPIRFERKWYSRQYDWSPMPYSIFFHRGYALHGTYEKRQLGRAVSHGCVRLLPANAATLFWLARKRGRADTRIVVTDGPLPPLPGAVPMADAAPQIEPRVEPKDEPNVETKAESRVSVAEAAIELPAPPPLSSPEPETEAAVVVAKPEPVTEPAVAVSPERAVAAAVESKPAEPDTTQVLAGVPVPRPRQEAASPKPRPAPVVRSDAAPTMSVGNDASVIQSREAWLRSLDRKYGIVR